MTRSKFWIVSIFFLLLDGLLVGSSFYFATFFRSLVTHFFGLAPVSWDTVFSMAQLGILFILGIFFFQGLYPGYGLTAVKELEQMSKASTLSFILLTTLSFLNKSFIIFPRSIIVMTWLLCLILLPVARFLERNLLSRTKLYGLPVIVFGDGSWAKDVIKSLQRVKRLGWYPASNKPIREIETSKIKYTSSVAILAFEQEVPIAQKIRDLSQKFRKVVLIESTNNYGSLWVEIRDLDSFMGLEYQYHLLSKTNNLIKRITDILASLLLLFLLSPLMLIVALLIKLDSKGTVLYRQERLGRDFKPIIIYKFRSMVLDADQRLQALLDIDPEAKAMYKSHHKLVKDPRVTKIGRFIRRFSIDEFPQLLNVLKGEMSLSGPRAYLPSELEEMGSYAATILRVNPGMTGWWQVLGRHSTSFQKRLQMDEYYISNWSIWMDVYIYLKTFGVVIFGKGA
ncbi:MAG: undecaprenyl-phosphate galactose phosphotransferase WbaP [Anaerolinea sp.]|nr:undecaprenyl-phosphate galactose phosphotransferase WbaP [Anaerolinea sp.]